MSKVLKFLDRFLPASAKNHMKMNQELLSSVTSLKVDVAKINQELLSSVTSLKVDVAKINNEYVNMLKGQSRFCNICGHRFSHFLEFNSRKEARCPICSSLERTRHLYSHLLSLAPFLGDKKVLHFAPEKMIRKFFLSTNALYFDADINPLNVRYAQDITEMTFENDSFDYFIAIHVLEHVVEDMKALREINRVLKIGAIAFLCVPFCEKLHEDYTITSEEDREKFCGQSDHVRFYDESTFRTRIESSGFSVKVSKRNCFPKKLQEEVQFGGTIMVATKIENIR